MMVIRLNVDQLLKICFPLKIHVSLSDKELFYLEKYKLSLLYPTLCFDSGEVHCVYASGNKFQNDLFREGSLDT